MSIKTIILVIILAILIGLLIVFIPKFLNQNNSLLPATKNQTLISSPTPTPLPTPNPVSIDQQSNLKEEINKIKIPDFSEDFKNLKNEVN